MILKEIILRDYGSYGPIQRFKASPDINIIIGKNSVGKSILMDVLRKPDEDITKEQLPITFLRLFILHLTEEEKRNLIQSLPKNLLKFINPNPEIDKNLSQKVTEEYTKIFYDFLSLPIIYQFFSKTRIIYIGPYLITPNLNLSSRPPYQISYITEDIIDNIFRPSQSNPDLIDVVKNYKELILNKETSDFVDKYKDFNYKRLVEENRNFNIPKNSTYREKHPFFVRFLKDYNQEFLEISAGIYNYIDEFFKNIYYFSDVRDRPDLKTQINNNVLTGKESSRIFFTLFTSKNLDERESYNEIVKQFTKFYPNTEIFAAEGPEIYVKITDRKNDDGTVLTLPLASMGMGFVELVTFFINIFTEKNKIFILEEPENHLHPNNQRNLMDLIKEASGNNQFFIISHSPNFINIEDIYNNTIIRRFKGFSRIIQIDPNQYSEQEIKKYHRIFSFEHPDNLELFFADKVLLVEGGTEKYGMMCLAALLTESFHTQNIVILNINGKHQIPSYHKLVKDFEIPYLIVCDEDAENIITLNNIDTTKVIVMNPDFEGPLRQQYHDIFVEASKFSEKKPFQFQYVLEKVAEKFGISGIPNEYKEIIQKIINL